MRDEQRERERAGAEEPEEVEQIEVVFTVRLGLSCPAVFIYILCPLAQETEGRTESIFFLFLLFSFKFSTKPYERCDGACAVCNTSALSLC